MSSTPCSAISSGLVNHMTLTSITSTHRSWQYDATSESYVVVATSVSHPSADLLAGIRATELATRYLIEPLDRITCRLTFICRADMRWAHSHDPIPATSFQYFQS